MTKNFNFAKIEDGVWELRWSRGHEEFTFIVKPGVIVRDFKHFVGEVKKVSRKGIQFYFAEKDDTAWVKPRVLVYILNDCPPSRNPGVKRAVPMGRLNAMQEAR